MIPVVDELLGDLVLKLLRAVRDVMNKAAEFKPTLEKLQTTLETLGTDVDLIEELQRKLDRPPAETKRMKELMSNGKELVLKCSTKVDWWKRAYKQAKHQEKLIKLDEAILRYFQLDVQAQILKYELENLAETRDLRDEFRSGAVFSRNNEKNEELRAVCAPPKPPLFTVGLDAAMVELKGKLLPEEVTVSVHTVTGLKGVGKTILARTFCWDEQVKGKFKENIFFLTLGKMSKLNTVVQKLFQHNGYKVPQFESNEDAIYQLENLLKQIQKRGPILLVLDNICPGSESLVDNFVFEIPNYKILVTSGSAITRFGSRQFLKPLGPEDDVKLFYHSASLDQRSSNIAADDVKKIVKACHGSPSALIVTGKSIRLQEDSMVWHNKAKALSKGQSILDSNNDVLACLQKSLDVLGPMAIECFKDLGLFPEDQRIPVAALVDMWAELYSVDDMNALEKIYQLVNLNMADIIVTRKVASGIVDYNYQFTTMSRSMVFFGI